MDSLQEILTEDFYKYIDENKNCNDVFKLLLSNDKSCNFDKSFAITQISCRKKFQHKIPTLLAHRNFIFPKSLSGEQCSHEMLAKFHATLFNSDDTVLDLTAGLGVDGYFIGNTAKKITLIERDKEIFEATNFNLNNLLNNATVINCDAESFISKNAEHFDKVFIDPARRSDNNKRLFAISDCSPNVIELMPKLAKITKTLIIKASPMLDISKSIADLQNVSHVYVLSVNNECKELVFVVNFSQKTAVPAITAVDFSKNVKYELNNNSNSEFEIEYDSPTAGKLLFEPNASIMKAQIFNALSEKYSLKWIHKNSHIFLSDYPIDAFPGRVFEIKEVIDFKDSEVKHLNKRYKKLNISVRNFKLSAENLKKRLKVSDGGEFYLFGTTTHDEKMKLIITKKVNQY